ncbi:unnamed protein product [Urochloa decumbens]|uniref:F-box domain-containing protein n=1 Tax=Urochloa decumbens TaxID=240449 RepID=A0ABC8V6W1_9POAL
MDRRLGPAPPHRRPKPKPQSCPDGDSDGVDRISGLPDHLIEEILRRLRCARSATRISLLSRRWRHLGLLWRGYPEFSFRGVEAEALPAALAQVARPELSLLDIDTHPMTSFKVAGIASLLRTAARLAPVELVVSAKLNEVLGRSIPFELQLPCFHRAKSITLELKYYNLNLRVTGGEFPVLERLFLVNCDVRISDLISRAPRLRSLQASHHQLALYTGYIMVHSTTLEELLLDRWDLFGGIDIVAPALKTFTLSADMVSNQSRITLTTATVEHLSWTCIFCTNQLIHGVWSLSNLKLKNEQDAYVLSLCLNDIIDTHTMEQPRNLQEIVQLPIVSVLELDLDKWRREVHVYGPLLLNLLGMEMFADIKRLKLVYSRHVDVKLDKACPSNCTCGQPQNWRSQSISLMALEVVEIEDFIGKGDEVDFLKLLFRSAPMMKRVTVKPCSHAVPSFRACKEICNIFREHPSVKCYSYDSYGKKVLYPHSTYAARCRGR